MKTRFIFVLAACAVALAHADGPRSVRGATPEDQPAIDMAAAVHAALAETEQAYVLDAELKADAAGKLFYEVDAHDGAREYDIKVDAGDGTVLSVKSKADHVDEDERRPTLALADILAQVQGRVVEAELDEDDGRLLYDIKVFRDGHSEKWSVDADSGKRL